MDLRKILLLLLFTCSKAAFGFENLVQTTVFDNVIVKLRSDLGYEEVNRIHTIGKMVSDLSKLKGYQEPIFLRFEHDYYSESLPQYFLSFDKITDWENEGLDSLSLSFETIIILRQSANAFNPEATLKLINYATNSLSEIKEKQKRVKIVDEDTAMITSIDRKSIQKILRSGTSSLVSTVLRNKYFRFGDKYDKVEPLTSYFFQNGKFHVFHKPYKGSDTTLLAVNNIYQFEKLTYNKTIVFNSDSTFYFISYNPIYISPELTIKYKRGYRPYVIGMLDQNNIVIQFQYSEGLSNSETHTLLYSIKRKELIQDIENITSIKQ